MLGKDATPGSSGRRPERRPASAAIDPDDPLGLGPSGPPAERLPASEPPPAQPEGQPHPPDDVASDGAKALSRSGSAVVPETVPPGAPEEPAGPPLPSAATASAETPPRPATTNDAASDGRTSVLDILEGPRTRQRWLLEIGIALALLLLLGLPLLALAG